MDIVLLTLMMDLDTTKDLLTYHIDYNISWEFGRIDRGNYSLFGLSAVPSFYLFNQTGHEIKYSEGRMTLLELVNFIDL
jgi:hypothetical protein